MLQGRVSVVEGIIISEGGVLAPVRIFTPHHMPAIKIAQEKALTQLQFAQDAQVEELFVGRLALDPLRTCTVDIDGGEQRATGRARVVNPGVCVANFERFALCGIARRHQIALNSAKVRYGDRERRVEEFGIIALTFGEVCCGMRAVGDLDQSAASPPTRGRAFFRLTADSKQPSDLELERHAPKLLILYVFLSIFGLCVNPLTQTSWVNARCHAQSVCLCAIVNRSSHILQIFTLRPYSRGRPPNCITPAFRVSSCRNIVEGGVKSAPDI